jgi:hypothetical protein
MMGGQDGMLRREKKVHSAECVPFYQSIPGIPGNPLPENRYNARSSTG